MGILAQSGPVIRTWGHTIYYFPVADRCHTMPQGNKIKIKTKGGKPPPQKGKPAKKPAGVKKGKLVFAPRKMHHQDVYKFKKNVQKCINANIEKEMKEKAQTFEAKPFNTLNKEVGATGV